MKEKEQHVSEMDDLGKQPESAENSIETGNKENDQVVDSTVDVTEDDAKVETSVETEVPAEPDMASESKESEPPAEPAMKIDTSEERDEEKGTEGSNREVAAETADLEAQDNSSDEVDEENATEGSEPEVTAEAAGPETKDNSSVEVDKENGTEGSEPEVTGEAAEPKSEDESSDEVDEDEHHEEEEEEEIDYSKSSKQELVEAIMEWGKADDVMKAFRHAMEMAPHFNEIRSKEREDALKAFIEGGGEEADFDMKHDELTDRFEANLRLIRDKRNKYIRERENQKEDNLEKKMVVLEKLREFVDSDETNISFNAFKELQEEWRNIGPVPHAQNQTLWANYHALVDRFYDNRSIYFELKELDRKKNLKHKLELCEKAEKLSEIEILKDAIRELNELHEEFKHIGPVPKEDQDALWERFKTASDAVYARRKAYVSELKTQLEANLVVKQGLIEKLKEFTSFDSDRIKAWNKKTQEILELQKAWEKSGGVPRAKAKEINKEFWGTFKEFFHNKNLFFKKLDAEREGNLAKKKELVAKAVELKDSEDWEKAAQAYKDLQKQWKEIGPVPQKFRESIYLEFKAACDHFFNRRREHSGNAEANYQENLKQKESICEEIEKLTGKKDATQDKLQELEAKFNEIGFVPKKAISGIRNRYQKAVEGFIQKLPGLDEEQKNQLILKDELQQMSQGPGAERRLGRKEQDLRREIGQLENDIALWTNNLEFFANSKTADKLKEEFEGKIEKAQGELDQLKQQLRILRKEF